MDVLTRMDATIIQLLTPRAPAAVHIIRLSGQESLSFLRAHTRLQSKLSARRMYYTPFFAAPQTADEVAGAVQALDHILCVYFNAPYSFTGEAVVELHLHGSLFIVDEVLRAGLRAGLRLAERGEFSYRAFLNGKLTSEQAEALDALIHARSVYTHRNAINLLQQQSSFAFADLQHKLLAMLATLESAIEFPEEDIPELELDKTTLYSRYEKQLTELQLSFQQLLANYQRGQKLEAGLRVVILGAPNVGKSTLLNVLLNTERALVSEHAGTTRDYIEANLELGGTRFILTDTAGLRAADDATERAGIAKTAEVTAHADVIILLLGLTEGSGEQQYAELRAQCATLLELEELKLAEREAIAARASNAAAPHAKANTHRNHTGVLGLSPQFLLYWNKSDLCPAAVWDELCVKLQADVSFQRLFRLVHLVGGIEALDVNQRFSLTQDAAAAIDNVQAALQRCAVSISGARADGHSLALLNVRQAAITERLLAGFARALELVRVGESEEILAEEFRTLGDYFSELGFSTHNEKLYDTLFKQFCIGK